MQKGGILNQKLYYIYSEIKNAPAHGVLRRPDAAVAGEEAPVGEHAAPVPVPLGVPRVHRAAVPGRGAEVLAVGFARRLRRVVFTIKTPL